VTNRKAVIDAKRKEFQAEEAHYRRIKAVFGTQDGRDVLAWVLDLCGFWASRLPDERQLGKFELGRAIFNAVCVADIDLASDQLSRRRSMALEHRRDEIQRIEKQAKEIN